MCGIAGFTRFHAATGDLSSLIRMGDSIAHRGPDAHGEYLDEHVGLSHRRLSIIDLSESGNQPMFSQDSNLVMVFNGEIYNFTELRKELEVKGYIFRTKTDSEVILALYQFEGRSCVDRLNGMFSIAIWDKNKKELFLARDRLGKKPLYYFDNGKQFIFASEIKAILEIETVARDLRSDAIYDFFVYQYVPESKTIYNNIHKLAPGHTMVVNKDGVDIQKYWDVSFDPLSTGNAEELTGGLLELIEDSTRLRMVSDVPLGAFLSGGVDSSGIVALMANHSAEPVITCSIGFDSKRYDEVKYAKKVADQYGTNHHELTVKEDILANLEHIVGFFDEPFADQSLVPTYFVSQLAREKVTVALAGDGGDENFAGYSKYAVDHAENDIRNRVPEIIRNSVLSRLAAPLSSSSSRILGKAGTLFDAMSKTPAEGFYLTNSFMTDRTWSRLANKEMKREVGDYHPSKETTDQYYAADSDDHLASVLYTDIKTFLVSDILVKVDRMSMANSLEVRAPLLDYRVIEYAARIPSSLKLRDKEKKYILKKAFTPLLPDDILYRKKMGFSVPLAHWLRYELKDRCEKTILSAGSGLSNYFDTEGMRRLWVEHQSGRKNHSSALWNLYMFELWWKKYIG